MSLYSEYFLGEKIMTSFEPTKPSITPENSLTPILPLKKEDFDLNKRIVTCARGIFKIGENISEINQKSIAELKQLLEMPVISVALSRRLNSLQEMIEKFLSYQESRKGDNFGNLDVDRTILTILNVLEKAPGLESSKEFESKMAGEHWKSRCFCEYQTPRAEAVLAHPKFPPGTYVISPASFNRSRGTGAKYNLSYKNSENRIVTFTFTSANKEADPVPSLIQLMNSKFPQDKDILQYPLKIDSYKLMKLHESLKDYFLDITDEEARAIAKSNPDQSVVYMTPYPGPQTNYLVSYDPKSDAYFDTPLLGGETIQELENMTGSKKPLYHKK